MISDWLLPVIIVLNVSYLYFWLVVLYARRHGHIDRSSITNKDVINAHRYAMLAGHTRLFTIQITTKGGSLPVVTRGIDYVLEAIKQYPRLARLVKVEVITENASETAYINGHYPGRVRAFTLPASYQTPNRTQLKARALHYMVEMHRQNPRDAYIVHYDEESVFEPDNLARLVRTLLRKPIGISEGTISYGLDYEQSNPICRTLEANRPFGCHECYVMMTHPAPLHLHGSNLVIQEKLENQVGWDIGQYRDNPLIAEDLVFGLMAYLKFGKSVFGWHGIEMIEQPPFTLKAAYKQRERWIMGALQGVAHVRDLPGYYRLTDWERFKIAVVIRLRVFTYAIGMPVSVLAILSNLGVGFVDVLRLYWGMPVNIPMTFIAVPGIIMWLGATQLGLAQNLRFLGWPRHLRVLEHLLVLCITPIGGLFDTAGPFVAVLKWITGTRGIKWDPTPKLAQTEAK